MKYALTALVELFDNYKNVIYLDEVKLVHIDIPVMYFFMHFLKRANKSYLQHFVIQNSKQKRFAPSKF